MRAPYRAEGVPTTPLLIRAQGDSVDWRCRMFSAEALEVEEIEDRRRQGDEYNREQAPSA